MSSITDSEDSEEESNISTSSCSSEGDIPLGAILHYGKSINTNHPQSSVKPEGRVLSTSSTESESDESLSIKSDDEIPCCNSEQYVNSCHEEEEEKDCTFFISNLTGMPESRLRSLSIDGTEDAVCIYPQEVQQCLPPRIQDKALFLTNDGRTILYVKSPVMTCKKANVEVVVPSKVICDFFVFPPDNPIKILTFVTNVTGSTKHYNSILAQMLTKLIIEGAIGNLHLEHGVIAHNAWTHQMRFEEVLRAMQQKALDTALPRTLEMTEKNQMSAIRAFWRDMVPKFHLSSAYLNINSHFVDTVAYEDINKGLQQRNKVILTGGPGEGRTTIGQRLCFDYHHKGYNTVFFSTIGNINWDVFKAREPTLMVCDDVDNLASKEWAHFEKENDNVKAVLITGLESAEKRQIYSPYEAVAVDITAIRNKNIQRTKLEYLKMIETSNKDILESVRQLVVSNVSLFSGFPKAVKLYNQNKHCIHAITYFSYPVKHHSFLYMAHSQSHANRNQSGEEIGKHVADPVLIKCLWLHAVRACLLLRDELDIQQTHYVCNNAQCTSLHWNTLLMMAVERNNAALVELLMKDKHQLMKNMEDNTVIHTACLRGCLEILKIMLSVWMNHKDDRGQDMQSPVMMAVLNGHVETYGYLADEMKCELTGFDENGETIMHLACTGGNLQIVKSLMSREDVKVYLNHRGHCGRTPIMIAAHCGHRILFDWLLHQKCEILPQDFLMKDTISYDTVEGFARILLYLQAREHGSIVLQRRIGGVLNQDDLKVHIESKITNMRLDVSTAMDLLHWAADIGHLELATVLLAKGEIKINSRNSTGKTPIMLAASSGHGHMFDLLLEKGADLILKDESYTGLLHFACKGGNSAVVHEVLHHGLSDVNSKDNHGKTPVSYAVENGDMCIFETLLSKGGDVSVEDMQKNTLLHLACKRGKLEMERLLLSTGRLDINAVNERNRTPLLEAAYGDHTDVGDDLIEVGADLHIQDFDGNDVLLVASVNGNASLTERILEKSENKVYLKDKSGKTAIMKAAEGGHEEVYFLLRQRIGVITSDTDNNGANILHNACSGHSIKIVQDIISQKVVDINSRDNRKRTAVTESAEKGYSKGFHLLVESGCDLSTVDYMHRTILHFACIGGSVDIVKTILCKDIVNVDRRDILKRTPVMEAAEWAHFAVFEFLVKKGCSLSSSDEREYNILHYACRGGSKDIVKSVLSKNLVAIDSRDKRGRTPVMWAAERGHKGVFDLLLENRCDLSVTNHDGYNILHCACYGGNVDIVQYILSHNIVDIKNRDYNRNTPRMIAQHKKHSEIVALFKQRAGY